jgi:hypothetical protein
MSSFGFNRRKALIGGTAALGAPLLGETQASGVASSGAVGMWGRIANNSHHAQRIYTGLFFAGPNNPDSVSLFTRHPLNADRLDWTSEADIRFALQHLVDIGLNTIKLSYFGHEGETDTLAPTWLFSRRVWLHEGRPGTYTEAEQIHRVRQLFNVAQQMGLLIAPLIEVTRINRFFEYFPINLNELLHRAGWLLENFGDEPNYLRVFDKKGKPRHVLWQIEAIHLGPINTAEFAAGFDEAARLLHEQTGHLVGWAIDPTPLPPYGSHEGPDLEALRETDSVLMINPFNITSQGPGAFEPEEAITEDERLAYARAITQRWANGRMPYLSAPLPGYDAHRVFPHLASYGFNPEWLRQQQELAVESGNAGVSFDTVNGFTEGYNILPTEEDGHTITRWAHETIAAHRRHWI